MKLLILLLPLALIAFLSLAQTTPETETVKEGPIRILFLGHDREVHHSNKYYPILSKALGRDGIYFDYTTSVEKALGDISYLRQFDGLLLYANHDTIEPHQYKNLLNFIEDGGGFIPVHSASFCFRNEPGFVKLVGAQFRHHKGKEFTPTITHPDHPAMKGLKPFHAWDETYVHTMHGSDRDILMVRKPEGDDNITTPEPWTWTRTQGQGRVFYTASGHDQRVWSQPNFHQLLKSGILWAVGDARQKSYQTFLNSRPPLTYETRDHIPNYEKRPKPLQYQHPLTPADSLKYTQAPVGWKLELFAAEPQIVNPISLAWDEKGRLWAAETIDYPNEIKAERVGNDKIKILEDTNGDGRCDKVTVFADGLNIPTSLTFANGGIYVHHAAETLFLKDTDGDDQADIREVVLRGWGTGDTHAGPSNLRYGLDNQLWGTVGYSAYNNDGQKFGMGVYRFQKDGSNLEFLHQFNNNTWGLGFNDIGDVFGSTANNNPSFFGSIPATAFPEKNRDGGKGQSAVLISSSPTFHPITPNIRQVDVFGGYTAAAGHAFANSANFPESWRGKMAFVAGPTGNLLGKFDVSQDGSGFAAKNAFPVIASADEWFSPVAAEIGPDGNLWISDWYNFIIQHNPTPSDNRGGYAAKNGKGNAHINPNRDRQHGRIYRLVWDKAPPSKITSLNGATTAQLINALSDANQFWRLTAQRLLVDGNKTDATATLQNLSRQPGIGALHALWTLHGLEKLDPGTHRTALLSTDPALRRNAIKALPLDTNGVDLLFQSGVINDPDLTTRLAAFVALAQFPSSEAVKNAISSLGNDPVNREDKLLRAALTAASTNHGIPNPTEISYVASETNLVKNATWKPVTYSGSGAKHTRKDSSFIINSDTLSDTSWQTQLTIKADTRYRLSALVRTEDIKGSGRGALLNVHELQSPRVATKALKGTKNWTELSTDFDSQGRQSISINTLFGGWGQSTGTAEWKNITLNELIPTPTKTEVAKLQPADAVRGKELFHTHQVAACNRCHIVDGKGGIVGPALDGIATRKGPDYLRKSLLEPNADIAEGYPLPQSPMPPMGLILKPQEIEDLLAYLATLK
ncbi:MAG: PVC-type heme-binding CxxCH protein [Akkermansiaceae bacterium]